MSSATHPVTFAAAVPLAATAAYGLGPWASEGGPGASRVRPRDLGPSLDALVTAIDTAGRLGRQLLSVLSWADGSISAEDLASETSGADLDELARVVDRLVDAGLIARVTARAGGLRLTATAADLLPGLGASFSDQNAITADALARICTSLGMTVPRRKQERIDAVAEWFADRRRWAGITRRLSAAALDMLEAIAKRGGPRPVRSWEIGVSTYDLHLAARFRSWGPARQGSSEAGPLVELAHHGIVGVAPYDETLWIWREAWPLLDRPLYRSWPAVGEPSTAPMAQTGLALPPLLTTVERALQHWDLAPPPVLKNGDRRFSKAVLRSTAKALSTEQSTVELVARAALSVGLLLPNVAKSSGRGRQRTVDEVWLADPELRAAWSASPASTRWLRLLADWTNPGVAESHQLVANRHLVLWDLASLPAGVGWTDDTEVAAWCEHRYWPVGDSEAVIGSLGDLRALGVVTATGPASLTQLGRLALRDPGAVAGVDLGSADTAVVQADHTVVCPPNLDSDLAIRLGEIATLESASGARIFRLDEPSITAAVQSGDSAASIIGFLESLSSVPVADTVRQLVDDAAARADRVKVLGAATVVVTTDPADLAVACRVKAAKLTAVTPTAAVSSLAPDKVRQALDRKGLAPLLVTAEGDAPARRRSEDADRLEQQARRHRDLARDFGNQSMAAEARRLEQAAAAARDPASRLEVTGPLAVTPELVGGLVGG